MSSSIRTVVIAAVVLFASSSAYAAAPSISLAARLQRSGRNLAISLTPSSSAAGCSYSLFGSARISDFEGEALGGRSLVMFPALQEVTKRSAKNLQFVRQSRRKVYLRAQLNCAGESSISNVVTLSLRAGNSRAYSVSRWLRQVGSIFNDYDITLVPAFSSLTFSSPIALVSPGDGSGRLFAVERGGRIYVFRNRSSVTFKALFLDISSRIASGSELGLLGLAFHPQYAQNGRFFVNYTEPRSEGSSLKRTVIAGFTVSASDSNAADPNSEQRYIVLNQPFDNHNGGDLAFGPDGYLYIGLGDGGSGGDPQGNGQDRTTLLGKMLRIDVDNQEGQLTYAIPADNPYKANQSGFREEIFAYGLRNPFRFSFDSPSGRLWAGDVGQGEVEEIDLITSGANYGWNTMEGSQCYPSGSDCSNAGLTLPVTEYSHAVGQSIIGGYTYYGRSAPKLRGLYIFGDFVSGGIFSLLYDGVHSTRRTLLDSGLNISSFGRDENGEVYVVSYGDGKIYKIDAAG